MRNNYKGYYEMITEDGKVAYGGKVKELAEQMGVNNIQSITNAYYHNWRFKGFRIRENVDPRDYFECIDEKSGKIYKGKLIDIAKEIGFPVETAQSLASGNEIDNVRFTFYKDGNIPTAKRREAHEKEGRKEFHGVRIRTSSAIQYC